jgi:hypothetical protein
MNSNFLSIPKQNYSGNSLIFIFFEGDSEITHVTFSVEELKFVGENILSPLKKLNWADFSGNP